jgi:hypothetical protein
MNQTQTIQKRLQTEFLLKDTEVTPEKYEYMLGVLPPREMVGNAFLVGEPTDHNGELGCPRYALYFEDNGRFYYGGLTTAKEFRLFLIPA